MIPGLIFCVIVVLATLAVIVLALFSPVPYQKSSNKPWVALSFHIQQSTLNSNSRRQPVVVPPDADHEGAFVFRRSLTQGPENTSHVIGKAQGFIFPVEHFAHSAFNIVYLTFETAEYSGSIGVQANKLVPHRDVQELTIVGGTRTFAFARGFAIFIHTDHTETYHFGLEVDVKQNPKADRHLKGPRIPQWEPLEISIGKAIAYEGIKETKNLPALLKV